MYCRNCGTQVDPRTYACPGCGVPMGVGNNFCPNCGNPTDPQAIMCVSCGMLFALPGPQTPAKSRLVAGLLGIFLGYLGVHNFYLGRIGLAVGQLIGFIVITIISCGTLWFVVPTWGIIEGILILAGKINKDGKGIPLKD